MKVTVNRQLSSGQYIVRFGVSDFSPDELAKMNSFGIPVIQVLQLAAGIRQNFNISITQLNPNLIMSFPTEEEARKYEANVLDQISKVMKSLREGKDGFTSTQEVNI
jgi:hypothetical protein